VDPLLDFDTARRLAYSIGVANQKTTAFLVNAL
jgi:hypothetical protein